MSTHDVYEDGVLAQRWDNEARTYTDYRTDPDTVRAYTPEENAAAEAAELAATEVIYEGDIVGKIVAIDMPAMQALLDATNATINAGPAPYLKDIARAVRRLDRKVLRLLDGSE